MTDLLVDLLEQSRSLGFLGPGPVEPHFHHAAAYAAAVTDLPARALDLGAGGGLPGLVLAARAWPGARWSFVDAQARRTAFLTEAVEQLGMAERVEVITERAEVLGRDDAHRGGYDVVVARSFGAPAVLAECAAPLLPVGGVLVASEPPDVSDLANRWPTAGLAEFGLGSAEPVVVDTPAGPVHLVRVRATAPVPDRYPRRTGIPTKRPLF